MATRAIHTAAFPQNPEVIQRLMRVEPVVSLREAVITIVPFTLSLLLLKQVEQNISGRLYTGKVILSTELHLVMMIREIVSHTKGVILDTSSKSLLSGVS